MFIKSPVKNANKQPISEELVDSEHTDFGIHSSRSQKVGEAGTQGVRYTHRCALRVFLVPQWMDQGGGYRIGQTGVDPKNWTNTADKPRKTEP